MQRHGGKGPTTPETAFARALKEFRQERALSQEALGFESGYHRTYISLLERGLMNPSLRTILSLASVLNVPASEIVHRVETYLGKGWKADPGTGEGRRGRLRT